MTHKDQIEAVIRDFGGKPNSAVPSYLKNPQNQDQFDLAIALAIHNKYGDDPTVYITYDSDWMMTGVHGIAIRKLFPLA
jgi:hypothetical protein